ncbi:hypothetical protein ACIQOU_19600 [Streptomyces sp. NPDC091279]|uniref:hypothetical protein n=1 Tax=unclassified Streptomyces TaxID=2593676 RepID=UPI00382A7123
MNRRPTVLAALTLTTVTALCLSACGNDDTTDNAKDTGKIAGADTDEKTSASPTPSAADSAGRPEITFPSDAKNVFKDQKTGSAVKDAVVADSALATNAVDEAIFQGSTGTKALGFYNTGKALSNSITYVQQYIDKSNTWVGETRYYDYKVTLSGDKAAYVAYCSDESDSYIKNKKTKKVDKSPGTSNSFVEYHTKLAKNAKGVWQTTDIASTRGSKACQQ